MDLEKYISSIKFGTNELKILNKEYFLSLKEQFDSNKQEEFVINDPENEKVTNLYPLALLPYIEWPTHINYEEINETKSNLSDYELILCKMHAGIGSSVKRVDYLKKISGRETLGSKGTDLFLKVEEKFLSLAKLQFIQAQRMKETNIFKTVKIRNLVNEETYNQIDKIERESSEVEILPKIIQYKMPTIKNNQLSSSHLAPGGHAFLGFSLLLEIYAKTTIEKSLIVIGNGEDLNSTADKRMLDWVVNHDIPITMITTTKLEKDKKGGQISLVKDETPYITIIEKAQAQKCDQLEYFEKIGLREGDNQSLFNTNIVIINESSLKKALQDCNISEDDFKKVISPSLIKNKKNIESDEYIQLEGAIGSSLLNLDRYFRQHKARSLVSFLNLDPESRENFFIPIKKMDDFLELQEMYEYNKETGRLKLRT